MNQFRDARAGGPGPGTPYSVTFIGALAGQDNPAMTTANAFTGGSFAVRRTPAGNAWERRQAAQQAQLEAPGTAGSGGVLLGMPALRRA